LLLVIGLAIFEEPAWKQRLALLLVAVAAACAIVSYFVVFFDIQVRQYLPGVVLRTHSFQGMLFSVAAFASLLLLRDPAIPQRARPLLAPAAALLALNVVFVTPGRSGYVVLVLLALALVATLLGQQGASRAKQIAWGSAAAVLVIALLASSPIVRQRIALGLAELQTYEQGTEISSMGERIIYMRNGLALVAERPFLGYGTGSFATAYAKLVEGRNGREGLEIHDPHNQYLNIAAQHGLVGLAVFLAILVIAFRTRPTSVYGYLGLSVLAAWCVTSLFSSHFSTFAEGRFIWLWLGVCLARD
jgi:O-antigen ligase